MIGYVSCALIRNHMNTVQVNRIRLCAKEFKDSNDWNTAEKCFVTARFTNIEKFLMLFIEE